MNVTRKKSTRRAFFLTGGAALGAGVATTVAGAAARERPLPPDDREAIRRLHLAFATLIESQRYEAAADLFAEHADLQLSGVTASGKAAIQQLFTNGYRLQSAAIIHRAYRQRSDEVIFSKDRMHATATFHVDVELCTPLQGDCTAAQMARLQGNVADRRWETGRLDATYVNAQGEWKIASLTYLTQ